MDFEPDPHAISAALPADEHHDLTPVAGASRLTTAQIVERIMTINPSASSNFLIGFRREALADYLDHLVCTKQPRGRGARWIRRGDTPGILAPRHGE
jgi:hypothetical protein